MQARFQLRARVFKINCSFAVIFKNCHVLVVIAGLFFVLKQVCLVPQELQQWFAGLGIEVVLQIWCFNFRSKSLREYVYASALDQSL